jgi:hypothetical protein
LNTALPSTNAQSTDQHVMSEAKEEKTNDDNMSVARTIGQKLQGKSDMYTLGEKFNESVWKAT